MNLSGTQFIFSDERRFWIARHAAFWMAWVALFTLSYGHRPNGFTNQWFIVLQSYSLAFVEALIYLPTHLLISYVLIYFLIPKYLFKGQYFHLLAGLVLTVLVVLCSVHFVTLQLVVKARHAMDLPAPQNNFYYALMAGLRGGLTVGGFAAAIKLMKYWFLKQQDNQLLIQQNLEAELRMLKAQVHPHFLFNTLNNLYALTLTQSTKSPEVVLKLSELLHYMLYDGNKAQVPLDREIQLLRNYVALESIRYEDHLDVSMDISGEIAGKRIAPLLLLPFLENSFKHGTSEQLDQAWINLQLHVQQNTLKFKLINGKNPAQMPANREGIGLQNVRKRLELLYPRRYDLQVLDEEETFMVVLTLELDMLPLDEAPLTARLHSVS